MNAYLYVYILTKILTNDTEFNTLVPVLSLCYPTNTILMQILNNAAAKQGKKFIHDLIN